MNGLGGLVQVTVQVACMAPATVVAAMEATEAMVAAVAAVVLLCRIRAAPSTTPSSISRRMNL